MIIPFSNSRLLRKKHLDKMMVFCSGSFDLVHLGHIRFLEACRLLGDALAVAVGTDIEIRRDKGPNRPIFNEWVRLQTIDAIRWVDYAFLNPPIASIEPLAPMREMLVAVQPDIWAVNHDASRIPLRKELAAELGIEFRILNIRRDDPRYADLSTTQIIQKIRGLRDS